MFKISRIKKLIFTIFTVFSFFVSPVLYTMEEDDGRNDHVSIDIEALEKDIETNNKDTHWKHIKDLYYPALAHQNAQQSDEPKDDALNPLEKAVSKISDEDQVKVVFDIISKLDSCTELLDFSIVDDTTYRDLNIFCGDPDNVANSFVNRTNNTLTKAGLASYIKLLYRPLCDINQLTVRQNGIRQLVDNNFLFNEIERMLKKLANIESKLLSFWHEGTQATVDEIMKQFLVKDPLPTFLQIPSLGSSWVENKTKTTNKWIKDNIKAINKTISAKANQSPHYLDLKRGLELGTRPIFDSLGIFVNMSNEVISLLFKNPWMLIRESRIERLLLNLAVLSGTWFLPEEYKANIWRAIIGGQICYWTSYRYKELFESEKSLLTLHKIMNEIAQFMITANELIELVKSYDSFYAAVQTCTSVNCKEQEKIEDLVALFNKNAFTGNPRIVGRRGEAISSFSQFKKMSTDFTPCYECIGCIDALMSIATLIKEHDNSMGNKYNYARYEKNSSPVINLEQFWCPFIDVDKAIPNDLTVDCNIILTGPNAGGKSTTLKSVALSALMAQTLTITPGSVAITPFDKIITLLNISDVAGKESAFQAHAHRVQFVLDTLNRVRSSEFVLLAPDELYNTTAEDVATALCSGIFKLISTDFPNARFVAATHYAGLHELEKETGRCIRNYKVREAHTYNDGSITWEYKIEPGINRQNIALQIAQQLYGNGNEQSQKILKEAQRKLPRFV